MCGTTPCDCRLKPSRRPAPSRPAVSPGRTSTTGRVHVNRYTRRDPFTKDRELRERQRARERRLDDEQHDLIISNVDDEEGIAVGHVIDGSASIQSGSERLLRLPRLVEIARSTQDEAREAGEPRTVVFNGDTKTVKITFQ